MVPPDLRTLLDAGASLEDARIAAPLAAARTELQQRFQGASPPTSPPDERCIDRFLVKCYCDVDAAFKHLQAHRAWRAATLPIDPTTDAGVACELAKGKFDAPPDAVDLVAGLPLLVVRSRYHDPGERDVEASVRAAVWAVEATLAREPRRQRITLFYDRHGFSAARNFDFALLRALCGTLRDNYPDTLDRVYVYPTGMAFHGLWKLIKPLLAPRTATKVTFPPTLEALLEAIPHEVALAD